VSVRLGHVILPAADVGAALAFFEEALGVEVRFRDGDRYAALATEGGTLALASPDEQPVAGRIAIGLATDDLDGLLERLVDAGIDVGDEVVSAHERRVTFTSPDGVVLVAYERVQR
jgi:predicted enzyme related to lactoylglutathione lyase